MNKSRPTHRLHRRLRPPQSVRVRWHSKTNSWSLHKSFGRSKSLLPNSSTRTLRTIPYPWRVSKKSWNPTQKSRY